MKEYTTLAIFTYDDGKDDKQSVYRYETYDEAVARFHSVFGYINGDGIKSIVCIVINKQGNLMRSEYWEKKTVETESVVTDVTDTQEIQ